MATGFNIQNMVSSLNTSGVASSSHFEVWITNTDIGTYVRYEETRDQWVVKPKQR